MVHSFDKFPHWWLIPEFNWSSVSIREYNANRTAVYVENCFPSQMFIVQILYHPWNTVFFLQNSVHSLMYRFWFVVAFPFQAANKAFLFRPDKPSQTQKRNRSRYISWCLHILFEWSLCKKSRKKLLFRNCISQIVYI